MPKSPMSDRQRDLLERIDAMERQVQAVTAAKDSLLGAPPLPATEPPVDRARQVAQKERFLVLKSENEQRQADTERFRRNFTPTPMEMVQDLGEVTGIGPMMRLTNFAAERMAEKMQGTPRQRAERAYGQGIEARIRRRQATERRFK